MTVRNRYMTFGLLALTILSTAPLRGGPTRTTGLQSKGRDQPEKQDSHSLDVEEDAKKKRRAERLEEMRKRAEATEVYRLVDGKRVLCEQHPEPIMRYDWQLVAVPDATLWLWVDRGRPVAAQKIEFPRRGDRLRALYGTFSLSPALLEVEGGDAPSWSTRTSGLEFERLPDAPKPSHNDAVRLRQMKQIHQRFSLYQVSFRGRTEHRLLPRPLYRYADRDSGVVDAAIFASSAHGTNPSVLFLVELRQAEGDTLGWHYALQHLGNADVHALLDGEEVWNVTDRGGRPAPTGGDTWRLYWGATPVPETLNDNETAPETHEE